MVSGSTSASAHAANQPQKATAPHRPMAPLPPASGAVPARARAARSAAGRATGLIIEGKPGLASHQLRAASVELSRARQGIEQNIRASANPLVGPLNFSPLRQMQLRADRASVVETSAQLRAARRTVVQGQRLVRTALTQSHKAASTADAAVEQARRGNFTGAQLREQQAGRATQIAARAAARVSQLPIPRQLQPAARQVTDRRPEQLAHELAQAKAEVTSASRKVPETRLGTLKMLGDRFGLVNDPGITQTTGGEHSEGSLHYSGRAIDYGTSRNSPAKLTRLANFARANSHLFREMYYEPAGFFIKDGKVYPGAGAANHRDHIHIAI